MKNQYEAVWFNTDGNRHELWPIYAHSDDVAKQQAKDFMTFRWGSKFVNMDSLKIRLT